MDYKTALLKQDKKIFTTDDLALIWEIDNRNTLLTTIKRYLNDKILYGLRRGLYSTVPISELDPFLAGTAYVKGFSYISLQTILARDGLINQQPTAITLVGGRSQQFVLNNQRYICRKMKDECLYNLTGIIMDDYPHATTARAIVDMFYYNSNFYFDQDLDSYLTQIKTIQQQVFS